MRVLGLAGDFESGKDLAAEFLKNRYGFHHVSFGQLVRADMRWAAKEYSLALPFEIEDLDNKPTSLEVRIHLQEWGQTRYTENPKYWLNKLEEELDRVGPRRVIINGVRRPNEFEYCTKQRGMIWKVIRESVSADGNVARQHPTERDLHQFPFHAYVANNGTVSQFYRQLEILVEGYFPNIL